MRCYGNITRTRNVSEYMLILALCLINSLNYGRAYASGTGREMHVGNPTYRQIALDVGKYVSYATAG